MVVVMTWAEPMVNREDEQRRFLERLIGEVLGEKSAVPVSTVARMGLPAPELLLAAETADLLVVGSRGHGAFAGVLLGSVSEYCVSHSPCPVVVVRYRPDPA